MNQESPAIPPLSFLTPKEQVEVAEIKKHKLRAKDELMALRRSK